MNKNELITQLLQDADIWHNISINFSKIPEPENIPEDERANIIWATAELVVTNFKDEFEDPNITPLNDSGKPSNVPIGKEKDSRIKGEVWQTGRSGATLYWDAYWNTTNFDKVYFIYSEDELREMAMDELRDIRNDINRFNDMVAHMMTEFYEAVRQNFEDRISEIAEENKIETLYQDTLQTVKKHKFLKRLINDLIE